MKYGGARPWQIFLRVNRDCHRPAPPPTFLAFSSQIDLSCAGLVESQALRNLPVRNCFRANEMYRIIALQIFMTALVALVSSAVSGWAGAVSAFLGGAVCFLPNALFAVRISLASRKPHAGGGAQTFFVGELVKLSLTLALLVAVARNVDNVVWPVLIISMIACVKSYLLVFWLDRIQYK